MGLYAIRPEFHVWLVPINDIYRKFIVNYYSIGGPGVNLSINFGTCFV